MAFCFLNTEKVLYCFYKIIRKIHADLKRHNRVYMLSSKHTYRPMRGHVVAQLFYNFPSRPASRPVIFAVKKLQTKMQKY